MRFHTFEAGSAENPAASTVSARTTKDVPFRLSTTVTVPLQKNLVLRSNNEGPAPPTSVLPQELSLVAFRDDVQFSYLFDNFVWSSYGSPWLQMAAAGRLDALSLEACRAFSLSIFGKHHHQRDIVVSGAMHYDHTVRALSSRLSRVGSPGSEGLIIPITILLMHSSTTPDPQASAFHIQGLLKLVQICGPERFAVNPLRLAFESCRATLITIGLITKTRTFLEQSVWIDEPWSLCGQGNKSPQNQLVDILVYVPGFLEDQAQLEQQPSEDFRLDLVQRIEYQVARLYNWRWHWEEINPNSVWGVDPTVIPSHQLLAVNPRPIRNTLILSTFSKAIEISLYNAVLLCLLGLLWSLNPIDGDEYSPSPMELSSQSRTQTPLHLPGEVDSLIKPAIEICRAFEFQLLNVKNSRDTALFWLFPLGLASKVLEDNAEYMAWIKDMLDSSQITRGYGTKGQNTAGFGFYKFPQIKRRKAHVRPMIQPQYDSDTLKRYSDSSSPDSGCWE
ncbi:hypothetical protein, variant 3 [Exophiala xenobiotica]|nr:hypothetical protein, variant 2 [Exophiala xenobiotica]XP_013312317.1 hypothetical protein, variant 3 [Exophiala xenobiotica]XP_013312318.1 hypothetical protein, variant 1 [Exophiala xenobiotica]KIW51733.1 hypothetical protein, variant 1 [Exophiala xenobiotica]KIW51734.1 hypothetical protein, variant 2 [Exophiala xenobiotica]KIW51735.1 hypothetical protein, variant 3 [Exophiala xenobiotica]